ncbi:MAG TPA: hypothetical protein VFI31_30325 [Pirellulales bacterium]|nr:hypothetical protein [Pirellulales bacterium]
MRYFTPELYLNFKASDRAKVVKAHDDWENAIQSYRQHLSGIGTKMTANARKLAESLCMHDADYLGMVVVPVSEEGTSLAVLLTRQDSARVFLVYFLAEQPSIEQAKSRWPYSKKQVHWLYDEFDVDERGVQQHEVLLSNGQIVTLRFHEMQIIEHSVEEPALVAEI